MPLTPNTTSSAIEVQAQSIVGQGALATLDTADTPQIAPNAITYGATLDASPTITLTKGAAYVQVGELVYQPSGGRLKLDILVVLGNPNDGDAGVLLSVRRGGVEIDNFPLIARETFDTPWTPFTFDDDAPTGVDVDYTLWAQIPVRPGGGQLHGRAGAYRHRGVQAVSDTPDPHTRLRVAIYAADGSVRGLMSGTLKTIQANTPPGGTWRTLPAGVRRVADVRRVSK